MGGINIYARKIAVERVKNALAEFIEMHGKDGFNYGSFRAKYGISGNVSMIVFEEVMNGKNAKEVIDYHFDQRSRRRLELYKKAKGSVSEECAKGENLKLPRVYISGPVSGLDYEQAKKIFNSAEKVINDTCKYEGVNPLAFDEVPGMPWEFYMKKDISLLMTCDYIFMLKGWADSRGAYIERNLARDLGIKRLTL